MFILGFLLGIFLTDLLQVKKHMTIRITNDRASFRSNVNQNGDTYLIILNDHDTISRGTVVHNVWQ